MKKHNCQRVDLSHINDNVFQRRCVGCLILTKDKKILLQQRDHNAPNFPNLISTFGGGIEHDETPLHALKRELLEELGASIRVNDVKSLGTITEPESGHQILVYAYFWHDRQGSIIGCYEGSPELFKSSKDIRKHPKVMNDVHWMLDECEKHDLL